MDHQKHTSSRKKLKGFTLVELIVVITILAILGTIGFLSIGGYSSKTRDSARVADVAQLAKSLDLSAITVGNYPTPDNYFTVTYSGSALWYQGTAGAGVIQKLHSSIAGGGLDAKPVDPLKNTDYTYSTLAEGKAYQIQAAYEGDLTASLPFVDTAYAAPGDPTVAYVRWNFGGLMAKTSTGTAVYVLAVPSLVTGSGITAWTSVTAASLSGTLLFNGKALKNSNSFNPSTVVFTGSKANAGETGLPSSTSEITAMMTALQAAYTGSDIKSLGEISTLLNASGNALQTLGTSVVKDQLGGNVSTNPVVDNTPLYTFTAHTFTNCGTTGNHWPSLAGCRGMYNAAEVNAWKNTHLNMTVNGIQEWTVPVTASYRIEANGAKGGDSTSYGPTGGPGARIIGTFSLTKGDKIKILVGQMGSNAAHDGSGGGGSFVTTASNSPLIIAGGGGGASASWFYGAGSKQGQTTTAGSNANNGSNLGGVNGGGGAGAGASGGGGGFTGNGTGTWFGQSFTNNGIGGTDGSSYLGGFGGGGSGGGTNGAGGGGGYSGGAACPWSYDGGGGGSYNAWTSPSNTAGSNSGHGSVIITKL